MFHPWQPSFLALAAAERFRLPLQRQYGPRVQALLHVEKDQHHLALRLFDEVAEASRGGDLSVEHGWSPTAGARSAHGVHGTDHGLGWRGAAGKVSRVRGA